MYYVYILKSKKNNQIYTGFTDNLKRRFCEHNDGESVSTNPFRPWVLIYYESYFSKKDAMEREKQFKKHAKALGQLKRRIKWSLDES